MKQVSLKSDHYCGSSLFGGNVFPPWGQEGWRWGRKYIMDFISHHFLPYETSFTRIGRLLWKFTDWGKRFSPMGARGLIMGEKIMSWFPFLTITFHMKQVSLESDHYCRSSLFGRNVFPHGGKGVDHGGKIVWWFFHFSPWPSIWNKFDSNRTIIVEVHYLGENVFPPWGQGA